MRSQLNAVNAAMFVTIVALFSFMTIGNYLPWISITNMVLCGIASVVYFRLAKELDSTLYRILGSLWLACLSAHAFILYRSLGS